VTGQPTRYSVFMVVNGTVRDGEPQFPTFIRTQAEALRNAGCEIFVSVLDDRTSIRGVLRNVRRLKTEIAVAQPQIVHAQYGSVTAAVARLIKGQLPLVVSFCGDDLLGTPQPEFYWRVRELCARSLGLWAASRATALIVKSRNLLEALPDTLKERAAILCNGVNTNWFKPMDQEKCRSELGWSNESKVVLFNASHNEDRAGKNPSLASETVSLLAHSLPSVRLHMISNVSSSEVRLTMNAADCLLVTSLHEGSPNIVKEAMACNLPVVSVPCGDVAERLQSTYPGGVASYDAAALARMITKVFEAGYRSNGREQLIAQRLTAADATESLMKVYRNVLEIERKRRTTRHVMHVLVNRQVTEEQSNEKNATITR
jgi:teichuronic acid biosynthesis glycosyltransferase TuaC